MLCRGRPRGTSAAEQQAGGQDKACGSSEEGLAAGEGEGASGHPVQAAVAPGAHPGSGAGGEKAWGAFEVAVCSVVRVSVAPAGERLPVRPLLRREYDALVDAGLLEGAHVELLDGMMVELSPQGGGHARAVRRLNELLMRQVEPPWAVSVQSSFAAGERSQPEPDTTHGGRVFRHGRQRAHSEGT